MECVPFIEKLYEDSMRFTDMYNDKDLCYLSIEEMISLLCTNLDCDLSGFEDRYKMWYDSLNGYNYSLASNGVTIINIVPRSIDKGKLAHFLCFCFLIFTLYHRIILRNEWEMDY